LLDKLPAEVQRLADRQFAAFERDPNHPSLQRKALYVTKQNGLRPGSFSVRINLSYRAIGVLDHGPEGGEELQAYWYWVGSREDYAKVVVSR